MPYPIDENDYSDNGCDDEDDVGDGQDGGNDDIIRHKIDHIWTFWNWSDLNLLKLTPSWTDTKLKIVVDQPHAFFLRSVSIASSFRVHQDFK